MQAYFFSPECDSGIGQHLLEYQECAGAYNDNQFTMLHVTRSSFHLATLEATFVKNKQPALCRQKEFIYALQLVHWRFDFVRWRNASFRVSQVINSDAFFSASFCHLLLMITKRKRLSFHLLLKLFLKAFCTAML